MRDLSNNQLREAFKRHGIKPVGILGYYDIGGGISVSRYNAILTTNRALLAYLLKQQAEKVEAA